jgi:hypothetical protein
MTEMTLEEMDGLWNEAKQREASEECGMKNVE